MNININTLNNFKHHHQPSPKIHFCLLTTILALLTLPFLITALPTPTLILLDPYAPGTITYAAEVKRTILVSGLPAVETATPDLIPTGSMTVTSYISLPSTLTSVTRHVPLPAAETAAPDLLPTGTTSITTHVPLPAAETATPKLLSSVSSVPSFIFLPVETVSPDSRSGVGKGSGAVSSGFIF